MASATIRNNITSTGLSFSQSRTRATDGAVLKNPTLAAAKAGTLTTRTDDNTGELTMSASHGITTGARLDVYWSGGKRVGMTVGTVSVNQVPIDGGSGDVLPADETAVTAMVPQEEEFVVTAANLQSLFVGCPERATAMFETAASAAVATANVSDDEDYVRDVAAGDTNPFGSNVAKVFLSHADSSAARAVDCLALVN